MNSQDRLISIGIVIIILVHLTVWIIGYSTGKLSYLISFLNLAVAVSILGYWIIKQLNIQEHVFELREIAVLCFEVMVALCALYTTVSASPYQLLKIIQYIFFGINITVLITAFIFMLVFKMTKLF